MNTQHLRRAAASSLIALIAFSGCSSNSTSEAADHGPVEESVATIQDNTDWVQGEPDSPTEVTLGQDRSATPAPEVDGGAAETWAAAAETTVAAAAAGTDASTHAAEAPAVSGGRVAPSEPKAVKPIAGKESEGLWDESAPERVTSQPPITAGPADITARDAGVNPTVNTRDDTRSTFAMDVDTGSYTLARTLVSSGQLPSYDMVRTEEFVNYFDQQYRSPEAGKTFAIHVDGTRAPFLDQRTRIVRVGIQGRRVDAADRKPVRLTFVVDNSGSMEEDGKLALVQDAIRTMLPSLRSGDRVSIVGFSDKAWVVLGPTDATDRSRIVDATNSMVPTDSTNAEAGLDLGYQQAQQMFDKNATNRVILLSDGVANVGPTGPEAILERIGDYARRDIDLSTVGVGTSSYNDEMMERLADAGDGTYAYIDSLAEAERVFRDRFVGNVETIARNAKVQVIFNQSSVASFRLLGFENRAVADQDFRNDTVDAGEIGAGHSVTALYEVTLNNPGTENNATLATVKLRWEEPNGKVKEIDQQLRQQGAETSFGQADPSLRLSVIAAAYAEVLRGAPWSRLMDLATVSANARQLVGNSGAFTGRPDIEEFSRLTEQAATLSPTGR